MSRTVSLDSDQVTIQAGRLRVVGSVALVGTLASLIFYAGVAYSRLNALGSRATNDEAILAKVVDVQQQQGQIQAQLVQGMGDLKDEVHAISEKLQ